jgi:hypothetical protein
MNWAKNCVKMFLRRTIKEAGTAVGVREIKAKEPSRNLILVGGGERYKNVEG